MIGWQRQFCRLTTWITSVAFGATGVVELWALWMTAQQHFAIEAAVFFIIATALLRGSNRFFG